MTEYRVGTVTVSGNRWFSSALLRNESGLTPGQTLTLPGVQSDLDWLNANPFRSVNAMLEPGAAPGTTNVVLAAKDRLPVHLYAAYDNAGVPCLGLGEWSIGGTWGNVAGLDQLLSYQFTRSISGAYSAHALSWSIPLSWRDRLLVFGSYATENPDIGSDFTEPGRSGQASLRYVHTLPRLALPGGLGLTEDVQLGYDFKTTNNDLEFGGISVFTGQAEIDQFPLIYDATLTDPYGQTSFQNQLVLSPGGMTGANNDEAFQTLVPGSAANYVYDRAGLTRATFLPAGFSWIGRVLGQVSDRNLLYSEQLGAGGPDSVRGYDTDTALGSQGVLLSNEIPRPRLQLFPTSRSSHQAARSGAAWDFLGLCAGLASRADSRRSQQGQPLERGRGTARDPRPIRRSQLRPRLAARPGTGHRQARRLRRCRRRRRILIRPGSALELAVPIEIVAPALVQIVRRKPPPAVLQLPRRRPLRWLHRIHPALARQPRALAQIARPARRDDILPHRPPAARARNDMVEREVRRRMPHRAILAGEPVAQKYVEPGEGRPPRRRHIVLERDHARQPHRERGRAHLDLVFVEHGDTVEEHRPHRVLPRPQREGKIGEGTEIRVQHQRGELLATVRQPPLLYRRGRWDKRW